MTYISETCIEIKIKLSFYFHHSFHSSFPWHDHIPWQIELRISWCNSPSYEDTSKKFIATCHQIFFCICLFFLIYLNFRRFEILGSLIFMRIRFSLSFKLNWALFFEVILDPFSLCNSILSSAVVENWVLVFSCR